MTYANKREEKFAIQVKRKLGCELVDCVSSITFTVTEFEHSKYKSRVRAYNGQCSKCHSTIKLTSSAYSNFNSLFGKTNLVITKSMFDSVFEADADK